MGIVGFIWLSGGLLSASQWVIPEIPAEPTAAEVLEKNGLAHADEITLSVYVEQNWDAADGWIPFIREHEEEKIAKAYRDRIGTGKGDAAGFWKVAIDQLRTERLGDRRRAVDAVLRKLGRIGTAKSLQTLLELSQRHDRHWVNWKAFASIQEILPRVKPGKLDGLTLMQIPAEVVGPLLRDLDPKVADDWAWTLWKHHREWLMTSFRSTVRLRTRIWLAGAFAASHPQEAWEVFAEGLQSQDPAIRLASEMILRTGIGKSLPYESSREQLAKAFASNKWSPNKFHWDIMPLPLDRPLLREFGARADLIWLSRTARISKTREDVWPMIRSFLPNGMFYSRVGDFFPPEFALSDADGRPCSRIRAENLGPALASHGGLWTIGGGIAEIHPDGSVLWACPLRGISRQITPLENGRIVLLGTGFMESRDRRGDVLWKTDLQALDDPRDILAVEEGRFLVSCKTSIGWVTREGNYQPVLTGLGSASWVRYHPTEPWIIFDGADQIAVLFDPITKTELGRFDLDDGEGWADSRFPFPRTHFPE